MISAVVLVKNQADVIERCLKSLSWCQEIVVIDDNSTDNSQDIAKKLGAKVFRHSLGDDFSAQRNFALKKVTQEWAFFVDADEEVPEALAREIYQQTSQFLTPFNGFFMKRVDYMWGKRIRFGEVGSNKFLRLARVEKGKWTHRVHEVWDVSGSRGDLKNVLLHYPHPTLKEFLTEINYYSSLRAKDLYELKTQSPAWQIVVYPGAKFIYNYIFRLGFLDGMQGMIIALMMSLHSFLVRGKLWQLNLIKKNAFN